MHIHLTLYSILRKKLPPEAKGRAMLDFPEGSTLADVLSRLEIQHRVVSIVNSRVENDLAYKLQEGDEVQFFVPIGGG